MGGRVREGHPCQERFGWHGWWSGRFWRTSEGRRPCPAADCPGTPTASFRSYRHLRALPQQGPVALADRPHLLRHKLVHLAPGTYTLCDQAEDSYDVFGDPFALTLQVQ